MLFKIYKGENLFCVAKPYQLYFCALTNEFNSLQAEVLPALLASTAWVLKEYILQGLKL